jgi:hypothetical protein
VCKNQNYLKNKVKLKAKEIKVGGRKLYAEKTAGKIKLDAASVPHDKCRENYAATYVTRQKDRGTKLKMLRGRTAGE